MKGWVELKEAFWSAVEGDASERARHRAALEAVDPGLPKRLEALLQADERGNSFDQLFAFEARPAEPPARVGGYDIVGVLGVGGMGEVYRARDARLHRDVAIKVLPAAVTSDRERLARFEREAQVLASLNHRNIAQLYGLDESGGTPALIMELVPGPTLAEVIAGDPNKALTLTQMLTIARQVADGLDAAHEKGIIHRDLKPSNVALTEDGEVKILDFGVAKSLDPGTATMPRASVSTDAGVVIGTPAYMSPEQARGVIVDRRTDIWAFGCLLYELLTGRQAFGGATTSDSLAAVLDRDPDMTILPARTPASVRSLLRHCLEKDPKRRLRDIADARLVVEDALNQPRDDSSTVEIHDTRASDAGLRVRALWLLAAAGVVVVTAMTVMSLMSRAAPADPPRRTITSLVLPRGLRLAGSDLQALASAARFAVSPDGRQLALIASDESGRARLWLRDLGSATFKPLPQTEDASFPFWSPDSGAIGFVAGGRLKAIGLSDDAPTTVNDAAFLFGAWSRNNQILFAPTSSSPLYVATATGGAATPATRLDAASGEVQHNDPAFLPDGRHFLYFITGSLSGGALDSRGVYLGSLDTTEPARLILSGATQARYASGHLLFVQNRTLMAQPFATESLELRGAPFPLVEEITLTTPGAAGATAAFSVSDNGVLAYQAGARTESQPILFHRNGRQLATLAPPADYGEVALSPDGVRLAMSVTDPARSTQDLWFYEVETGRGQRVTFEPDDEFAPVWSPDGQRLLFSSRTKGLVNLHIKEVATAGHPAPLDTDTLGLGRFAADWSRDGRHILYIGGGRAIGRSDVWTAPVARARDARALLQSPFVETQGRLAPRGPWFAYASNETGQLEVYIDRFPDLGAKRLVSTRGGRWPRWAGDGTELVYVSPENQLMTVALKATRDRLDVGVPRALFAIRPRPPTRLDAYPYDVSPDGQRFVVNTMVDDTTSTTITVVQNWTAAVPRQ